MDNMNASTWQATTFLVLQKYKQEIPGTKVNTMQKNYALLRSA